MPAVMEFSSSENKDKVNELIGFMLHQDMNFYKDVKIAINDFKKWLEDIKAIRPLKQSIDHEEVANNVIKTYGNDEESIYGIKPMYKKDIVKILKAIN
jgi:alcohol dehydrogenase class IV